MYNFIVPVQSQFPIVNFQNISSEDSAWSKIKFQDPDVKDEVTTMYQIARSDLDKKVEDIMEKELVSSHTLYLHIQSNLRQRKLIVEWAGASTEYEYNARGTRLDGWLKGFQGMLLVCFPANNLDWVELYTKDENKNTVWKKIPWCRKYYIILRSEDDVFGSRQKATMDFHLFRVWRKSPPKAPSHHPEEATQEGRSQDEGDQNDEAQNKGSADINYVSDGEQTLKSTIRISE
ncbi:hypothetical protein BX600DRAFT_440068 [Xylariales sp. PMI_506]|nr:hypothetical protein BX600DRAFT_440068 [Xylariales sp. PMI_506]